MIRTRPPLPLPGLVAARLGTPKGSAVATTTNAPNFAPDDAVDRPKCRFGPRYGRRAARPRLLRPVIPGPDKSAPVEISIAPTAPQRPRSSNGASAAAARRKNS